MLDLWRELELGQRRALASLGVVVLAVVVVIGLVAVTRSDGTHVALRTDASSTSSSSTSSTTSTSAEVDVTASTDPSAVDTVDSTATTRAGGTTTVTSKAKSGGKATATTKAPSTTRATTGTTQPPVATTDGGGVCNTGGGGSAANEIANDFCAYRADHGLATMTRNSSLNQLAQQWAEKMAADADAAKAAGQPLPALVHNPDYRDRVLAGCGGCNGWSENIAYNSSADGAWRGWLDSRPHLAAIQYGSAGEYGVGVAAGGGYLWFVQDFGYYDGSPG
jgi:uncharacterized protein YkwD